MSRPSWRLPAQVVLDLGQLPEGLRERFERARALGSPVWLRDVRHLADDVPACDIEVVPEDPGVDGGPGWTVVVHERVRDAGRQDPAVPAGTDRVGLGAVAVVDLFVILVENHHFEVREAVRLLTTGLLAAGYPGDSESVSASDAMDILEAVLGRA